jgi:hypothetical protein
MEEGGGGGGGLLQLGAGWGCSYSVSPFLPATLLKSFMFVVTIGVPANKIQPFD